MKKIIILLLCCGLLIAVFFIRNDLRVDKTISVRLYGD